ncbi:hypothetical protein Tco_1096325, partial [Tanacetum coccineum]
MIPETDLHCFDVHNDGYFFHLPLAYVNGVILEMIVRRMPYEQFAEYLEEKSGNYFQETFSWLNLYLDHLDMNLSEYLSQAITYEMDACVSKTIGPPKKRYCNDFSMDEMVDWAEMEGIDATEGVEAKTNTTDKGKEKVSQDATEVVEARRSMVESNYESEYDSDDDSDYQSDKSVDYLSPVLEEHDIYMNELLKSLKTADKNGITKDPFISVEKHVERYPMYDETTHWRLRKPKLKAYEVGEKYVSVAQFKECVTYYALENGFSLWYERSCEAKVVAKCGQRPPRLTD